MATRTRSPRVVNQTYETGCTWRMFGIFNFREGHLNRGLLSRARHFNTHATGNGSSRRSSDVLSTADEKYPHIGASSRRRRDYGCKSINCVENPRVVADQGNEVTKMIIDPKFVNKNYQGKAGAGCETEQLLDALQILYSNKELFLNLLQDPNSLLVKPIHDLHSSQEKEPYQGMGKRMAKLNRYHNSSARQRKKLVKSSNRYDSSTICEPQFSNKIVVLKPGTNSVKDSAETQFESPAPHPHRSFSYNVQNVKHSYFPLGRIKRKLRYVMRARREEQQWRKTDGVPDKFSCGCQVLQDGENVEELEIPGRNSLTNAHVSTEKIRLKDTELCMGKEIASFGESFSRITNDASVTPYDNYQMDHRTKLGLEKEGENGCNSSLGQKIKDAPTATIKAFGDKLQPSFQDSHPEIQNLSFSPEVASSSCERIEDTINMSNRFGHPSTESVLEHFTGENVNNPPVTILEPDALLPVQVVHGKFEENHFADLIRSSLDPTNNLASSNDVLDCSREILKVFSLKWDELVTKCESSRDPSTFDELKGSIGRFSCDAILLDCVIETFMDVYQNCGFPLHIARKSPDVQAYVAKKVLVREITEVIKLHFLPHPSHITLEQLVGMDLERSRSCLDIQVDAEEIVMELEEDVLENLVLEIVSEMDFRSLRHCNEV